MEALNYDIWNYFINPYFCSGFMGWIVAQSIKLTRGALKTKSLDFTYLLSTGGMPSAHSSLVMGVFVSLGLGLGFGHPITIVASVVATITMFDAATVRRAAGQQARLLNIITRDFIFKGKNPMKPLKEMLGHTRTEVYGGIVTGTLVAIAVTHFWAAMHWPNL